MMCVEEGLVERKRTALEDCGVEREEGCGGRRRLSVSELTSFNLPAYPMQTAPPGPLKTANVIAKSGARFEARPASRAEHT